MKKLGARLFEFTQLPSKLATFLSKSNSIIVLERIMIILALFAFIIDLQDRKDEGVARAWTLLSVEVKGNGGKKEALEYLNKSSCWTSLITLDRDGLNGCSWLTLKSRSSLRGVVLEGTGDTHLDLSDIDLAGADLRFSKFNNVRVDGADLSNASFFHATITNSRLDNTNFRNASFEHAVVRQTEVGGSDMRDVYFDRTNLNGSELEGVQFRGARFNSSCLLGTSFYHSSFRGAKIWHSVFTNARFEGADLGGVDLTRAYLNRAVIEDDGERAKITSSTIVPPAYDHSGRKFIRIDQNSKEEEELYARCLQ